MTLCGQRTTASAPYLGPAGSLVALPWMAANRYDASPQVRGGSHDLGAGGTVRDRNGISRRWVLGWPAITDDDLNTLRVLYRRPGPYRWLDPFEPNRLTANQSMATDETRDTTGAVARFQGSVASDTTQFRSGARSLRYDSETALAATGRGPYWYASETVVDPTWTAVRAGIAHSFSVWARASLTVSYQALIDWYTAAGGFISADLGAATALSTVGWTQLKVENKTAPSNAAYGIGAAVNTTTTGTAASVWFDDPQLEEGAAVTGWRLGAGTPLVAFDAPLAERMLRAGLREAELTFVELSR